MAVHFYEEDVVSGLKHKRKLKAFILDTVSDYLIVDKADINYIFCSDEALLERNVQYLQHDTFTDIITFDLSEKEEVLTGEIYISIDRVRENARTFRVAYDNELHRVIFHGILHLIGYNDKTPKDKKQMRDMEDELLKKYFENELTGK